MTPKYDIKKIPMCKIKRQVIIGAINEVMDLIEGYENFV